MEFVFLEEKAGAEKAGQVNNLSVCLDSFIIWPICDRSSYISPDHTTDFLFMFECSECWVPIVNFLKMRSSIKSYSLNSEFDVIHMNILKASIFSLFLKVLQRMYLAKFYLSSDPIVNVWAIPDPGKTSPKIGPSRCARFVFVILCNTLKYSVILCKTL